jgi:beta-galactosidase GanA
MPSYLLFVASLFLLSAVSAEVVTFERVRGSPYEVTYDDRAMRINGKRTLLLSGAVHYPRALPDLQRRALSMLKADGLNTVQTYSFWNLHEPTPDHFDWGSINPRANVTAFLDMCAEMGLFVVLRVGPFVCGEWHYGGIPAWVNQIPGVAIRQSNGPWQDAVERYVDAFMAKVEPYLAKHGGPIIMLQIENENGPATTAYAKWNAGLALKQNTQLPWLWCDGMASAVLNFPKSMPPLVGDSSCMYKEDLASNSVM